MFNQLTPTQSISFSAVLGMRKVVFLEALLRSGFVTVSAMVCFLPLPVLSQQPSITDDSPVIVQPGAPGQASRILPPTTRAKLPQRSPKDVEFMQGMIMHHAQAVEMVALMESRTENIELLLLGARISHTQADEINFMRHWLETRGEKLSMPEMANMDMPGMDMSKHKMSDHHMMLMPGMLSKKQMDDLGKAKGEKFEELFLKGMIQHHAGALVMVKEMFETTGAGQDAQIFNFATDIDSGQRAEIRIMQNMLGEKL